MIVLVSEELQDYCKCPILWEKKYVLKEEPPRDRTSTHFDGHTHIVLEAEKVIKELVGYYFHRLMDNRQVRYKTLYKRWERQWWEKYTGKEIMEYIVPVSRANKVRINTNLINHLPKFYNKFHKPFKPIALDRKVAFSAHDYLVTSTIQMAYKLPNGTTRIVKFVPYGIAPNNPKNDLDLVIQACGWMSETEEKEVEIAYYCMLSPNNYDPFTTVKISDNIFKSLSRLIKAFKDKETILPISCAGCEYKCEVNK